MVLPDLATKDDYVAVYSDDRIWLPGIGAICERHGLSRSDLRRGVLGTHVVFHTGNVIVKLFSRFWLNDFTAERAALLGLHGLPIPEIVEIGELESWPYIILTVLEGRPALDVWRTLGFDEKRGIVRQIGEFMQELHHRPLVPGLPADWGEFLAERTRELDDNPKLVAPWRAWVHRKVAEVSVRPRELVTLNCDLTGDHVLLGAHSGRWCVSGIIDFGDSMIGPPLYEFGAPLFSYCAGEPRLARELVEAYGKPMSRELAEEILAYCLLHKYMSLTDMLADAKAGSPDALFTAVWGDIVDAAAF